MFGVCARAILSLNEESSLSKGSLTIMNETVPGRAKKRSLRAPTSGGNSFLLNNELQCYGAIRLAVWFASTLKAHLTEDPFW